MFCVIVNPAFFVKNVNVKDGNNPAGQNPAQVAFWICFGYNDLHYLRSVE
jgi:hypothetical protein